MPICGWIILSTVLFIIAMAFTVWKCGYWRDKRRNIKRQLCWNDGFILDTLKVKFFLLSCLSIGVIVPYCIGKHSMKKRNRYLFVDAYVTVWLAAIIVFSCLAIEKHPYDYIILGLWSYRLFEIFQSWVSQYVLGGVPEQWEPRNPHRSLVLIFADYGQVIFAYAFFAFTFQDNFIGTSCWSQALQYSLGNAVTIGSDVTAVTCLGKTLLITQLVFTILFLTSAVNRVVAAMRQPQS